MSLIPVTDIDLNRTETYEYYRRGYQRSIEMGGIIVTARRAYSYYREVTGTTDPYDRAYWLGRVWGLEDLEADQME